MAQYGPQLAEDRDAGPALTASHIKFGYGARDVLHNVSFSVRYGEVVALLGANGAGKSTLLQILLGLQAPDGGEVRLGGRPLAACPRREVAQKMAYVPQYHVCPFPYRVQVVVAMGCYARSGMFGRAAPAETAAVHKVLEELHIADLAERPYTEISGGERQLVLLCRAILQGARLLILDEPASALDFGHQARLLAKLRDLADLGYAVVMSTHHPQHARALADRAVLLQGGQVIGNGPPADLLDTAMLQKLYGISAAEMAFLPGWV